MPVAGLVDVTEQVAGVLCQSAATRTPRGGQASRRQAALAKPPESARWSGLDHRARLRRARVRVAQGARSSLIA
ncbi:MAG: hypothetical protein K1X67_21080 [Fimbriimonadaceae bacterium]|nr:hypothetical protein [Fimbriimonadaceae bacterium]